MEKYIGLSNLASTCYINSIIQCLRNIPDFFNAIIGIDIDSNYNTRSKPFTRAMQNLFFKFMINKSATIAMNQFFDEINEIENCPFNNPSCQQDAKEFLDFLLDGLHEENKTHNLDMYEHPHFHNHIHLNAYRYGCSLIDNTCHDDNRNIIKNELDEYKRYNYEYYKNEIEKYLYRYKHFCTHGRSFVTDLFSVFTCSHVVCLRCDDYQYFFSINNNVNLDMKLYAIENVLGEEKYTNSEIKCKICKSSEKMRECPTIIDYPKIFITFINRSRYNKETQSAFKSSAKLKLSTNFTLGNVNFNLSSVVTHWGTDPNSGHYVSYVRNFNGWIYYNDMQCQDQDKNDPFHDINTQGYLGFYISDTSMY